MSRATPFTGPGQIWSPLCWACMSIFSTFFFLGGCKFITQTENGLASTGCLPVPVSCAVTHASAISLAATVGELCRGTLTPQEHPRPAFWSWLPSTIVDKSQATSHPANPTPSCRRAVPLTAVGARARPWLQDQGTWSRGSQWASSAPEHARFLLCNNCKRACAQAGASCAVAGM